MNLRDVEREADGFLQSEVVAGRFRGAVLLALGNEVVLHNGYGLANEEWGIPNTSRTTFRIGSITKMFTAAAILRLLESDAIDLHGKIGTWLEDLPNPSWQRFTVHQLLTHTAGLRDHLAAPAKQNRGSTGRTY